MDKKLARIGFAGTAIYMVIVLAMTWYRIPSLWSSETDINEVGDFLAGAFAPLAFLWLVLGFFQQGEELRNSNEALKLQASELRNSVDQQVESVKAQHKNLQNYASSVEPLLKVSCVDAGWGREGIFYCSMSVHNLGDYCERLLILMTQDGVANQTVSVGCLFGDGNVGFVFDDIYEWRNFEVSIQYLTRSGVQNVQRFSMSHYADNRECENTYVVKKHPFLIAGS
ncbi:hypothetical protein [Pseudomonas sp. LRF_L74]|uniref:hypothetical protein n=1 Tax=Pseudomonas sp. LRF_L74 TaxID=3369422 RepID=UPI003F63EBC7